VKVIQLKRFLTASQIPFSFAANFVSTFKVHHIKADDSDGLAMSKEWVKWKLQGGY
jgi:hypothetical protein